MNCKKNYYGSWVYPVVSSLNCMKIIAVKMVKSDWKMWVISKPFGVVCSCVSHAA